MTFWQKLFVVVVAGIFAIWGCDRSGDEASPSADAAQETAPQQEPTPQKPAVTNQAGGAPQGGARDQSSREETPTRTATPGDAAVGSGAPTQPPPAASAPPAQRPQAAPQPSAAAPPSATTPQATARALMDQLSAQTQQSNWAEAEKTLKQLQAVRAQVPRDMQDEIDNAAASFKAAKLITEGR